MAVSAWVAFRPREELAIIGKPPVPVDAIPRTQIASHAWIDFKVGGKHIVYPKPNSVPKPYAKAAGMSGVLVAGSSSTTWSGAGWTGTATWTVDGEPIPAGPNFLADRLDPGKLEIWPCPYVWGDQSKVVDLRIGEDDDPIRLRLPPNHQTAPTVEARSVKVRDWTLHLKPRPWISPSFPIRFEVTVEGGKKGQVFLMTFTEALDGGANLKVAEGQPAELAFYTWEKIWGVLMQIQVFEPETIDLSVSRTSIPGGKDRILFSHADTTIAEVTVDLAEKKVESEEAYGPAGFVAIDIQGYWPLGEFARSKRFGRQYYGRDAGNLMGFKNGQQVRAIAYKGQGFIQKDFVLRLPDPTTIPGTRGYDLNRER